MQEKTASEHARPSTSWSTAAAGLALAIVGLLVAACDMRPPSVDESGFPCAHDSDCAEDLGFRCDAVRAVCTPSSALGDGGRDDDDDGGPNPNDDGGAQVDAGADGGTDAGPADREDGGAGGGDDAGPPDDDAGPADREDAGENEVDDDGGAADAGDVGLCGDNVASDAEECDDGNLGDRDGCASDCTAWWDLDYPTRTKLTFDNRTSTSVQSFPVLVAIPTADLLGSELGSSACFVDADQQTLLAAELDESDPLGLTLFWVRVPTLDASSDEDHIWLYLDGVGDPQGCTSVGNVWDDTYDGVWHLGESRADSTSRGNDLSAEGGESSASGAVGSGRSTNTSRYLSRDAPDGLRITGDLSVELWASFSSLSGGTYDNTLVQLAGNNSQWSGRVIYFLSMTADKELRAYWERTSGFSQALSFTSTSAASFSFGEPLHIVLTRDTSDDTARFYVNGAQLGSTIGYSFDAEGGWDSSLYLGGNRYSSSRNTNGVVDEVRISDDVKSPAWIELQHLSMTGGLITDSESESR